MTHHEPIYCRHRKAVDMKADQIRVGAVLYTSGSGQREAAGKTKCR
jgi:hypothetical protein